ncbi:MAG: hypothetical protein QXG35_02435 [Nitrososphaerota archaeon]
MAGGVVLVHAKKVEEYCANKLRLMGFKVFRLDNNCGELGVVVGINEKDKEIWVTYIANNGVAMDAEENRKKFAGLKREYKVRNFIFAKVKGKRGFVEL